MLTKLAIGIMVASLGLSGLSYAGTGAPNPMRAVSDFLGFSAAEVDGDLQEEGDAEEEGDLEEEGDPEEGDEGELEEGDGEAGEPNVTRSTDGCADGFTGNHGEHVSSQPEGDRSEAAQSNCGLPEQAVANRSNPGHQGKGGGSGENDTEASSQSGDGAPEQGASQGKQGRDLGQSQAEKGKGHSGR